jgi:hypothetical protein
MILTRLKCPKCKGNLVIKDGLDGLFCENESCKYWVDKTPSQEELLTNTSEMFSEDRVKHLRGVPMIQMTIGSEVKGRISIQMPCSCTKAERRTLINEYLDDLQYLKSAVEERGLDIYSSRGGKKND